MTALPIRPIAETADTVTLSRSDFEALSELVEDAADLADIEAVKRKIAAGETEVFPFEIAEQLLDGGHPLRVFRDYRGFTLRGLAKTTGLSASYLSEIESGIKTGSVESLHRLAAALDVPLDMLSVAKS
jgi:antitoxin component HigA of HigAB toxin-antitoxin module